MVVTTQNGYPNREYNCNDHQANSKRKFQEFGIDKGKNGRKDYQDGNNIEDAHGVLYEIFVKRSKRKLRNTLFIV